MKRATKKISQTKLDKRNDGKRGAKFGHPAYGGRPPGITMPCGWGCGAHLTARQMRGHFTGCANRPELKKEE